MSEAIVQGGSEQYLRGLLLGSPKVGEGHLLYGLEAVSNNGPWVSPDNYKKFNGVLRYSLGDAQNGLSLTGMGYQASWNSTDQVPLRAIDDGQINRFGTIDPTDGGQTHRYSLSAEYQHAGVESVTRAVAYGIAYKLNLFSNFTYYLDDPVHGDQFEQADDRTAYGLKATHQWFARWGGFDVENEVGFQGRFDDIHNIGLYHTEARERLSTTREDAVRQGSAALFFQNATRWSGTPSVSRRTARVSRNRWGCAFSTFASTARSRRVRR